MKAKTTPVNTAVTADISLHSEEIPFSAWNYKPPSFHYNKMYNWNEGILLDVIWHLIDVAFNAIVWGFHRKGHHIFIN
jgi:hypothetical protein